MPWIKVSVWEHRTHRLILYNYFTLLFWPATTINFWHNNLYSLQNKRAQDMINIFKEQKKNHNNLSQIGNMLSLFLTLILEQETYIFFISYTSISQLLKLACEQPFIHWALNLGSNFVGSYFSSLNISYTSYNHHD